MKLKKIQWKNYGPYGNALQEIKFDENGSLWMVSATNGSGKSMILNLPKVLYYGKLDNFKKEDIANRFNKHCEIYGWVETSPDTEIYIERKICPTSLYIEKNGVDIGKAGISDYQSYIDNEVTCLPYNIFSNIISLSINDFKSFISMTPNDKRIIIDKLFAMEIINKMSELIKKDLRDIKINIDIFDREILTLKSSMDAAILELKELKNKVETDNTNRIEKLTKRLTSYIDKIKEAKNKQTQYSNKDNEIKKSYHIFLQQKLNLNNAISSIEKEIELYNQDKCPTCKTPFNDNRFALLKEELSSNIKSKKEELELLLKTESQYKIASEKINDGLKKINEFLLNVTSSYKTIENELKKLKEDKPKEFQSIQKIISDSNILILQKENQKVEKDTDLKYLDILENLYGDDGVKKKILESYLPTLNKEIEYTLNELHFPYSLKFNNEFDPDLEHLGIPINEGTLSTGEKKRVDLAVLISIIRMLKRKYPRLNIFMLDEVLSSIDSNGIYDIIGMLQKTAKELNMHIFIVNHSPLPVEFFSWVIEVNKNNGFSDITITNLEDSQT